VDFVTGGRKSLKVLMVEVKVKVKVIFA